MKSLANSTLWTGSSTLIKIGVGLLVVKLLAIYYGPKGVGLAANYMTLLTVLGVFAGAGIFNGVTKYVSQFEHDEHNSQSILGSASFIILCFSLLLGVVMLSFAKPIAQFLFTQSGYHHIIQIVALCQLGIALSNYFLAILRGYRDAKYNAISTIVGALLGVLAFLTGLYLFDYQGALIGLALVPGLAFIPALLALKRYDKQSEPHFKLHYLKPHFNRAQSKKLLTFSVMVFVTAITIPVAYILMRNWLNDRYGLEAVGLWQGVSKISDAYLQFVTAAFSVYLLPTFAKLSERAHIKQEIGRALKFVFPVTLVISVVIYLLRDVIIRILFSKQFSAMDELFFWQLCGDIFKVSSYIFGYLIVAKAALRLYILAEVTQFVLLLGSAYVLIPLHGAQGATQSYMLTYILYFLLCLLGFWIYQRKGRA
ncbi:lipid III flippase WzxE [Pasteurellaceae bacterium HPA106]|uniref:lipid III flippase WzxE n=1 Tax=Spirabiliibacterium pneumoniae TaxID=221400 RepID=UPI001AACF05C|nr:lipid III flippase WzxE [Spirabiliibacterium pneumoniae]MBE2896809.1 lipid III flippase WzxE [Spirabiliibacterium pneumoniae]